MNLDDLERFKQLDTQNMLAEIDGLPDQLDKAFELGMSLPLGAIPTIRQVVISGMGGSAIGADLLVAYISPIAPVAVTVHRDYGLPAWARGPEVLVITSSHSGNTEETLESFEMAQRNGCSVFAISTGGELTRQAKAAGIPVWSFEHKGQPRAAVGYSFGLLLALFTRLGIIPDQAEAVNSAVKAMKESQAHLQAGVPAASNAAKRYAGQLLGRWVTVMGAGMLAPVARRIKGQINEIAKAGANFEFLPEANHNTLAGLINPEDVLMAHTLTFFLRAPSDLPRHRLRIDLTKEAFMREGLNTDFMDGRGDSALANMWTLILFGDYMAYYLAMAYGMDPTPVEALEGFKEALKKE
jgi:glucose/mannose-6-phosphate isomerase